METEPTSIAESITSGKLNLIFRHLLQIGEGSVVTAEGYHVLGRTDAPATLEMYSDFL